MKIVLIADPHVLPPGGKLRGIETASRLEAAVAKINELAADADLCVVLGDSVNESSLAAYDTFLERLAPLRMPIRYIIGNHDDRELFLTAKPDLPHDANGFLQSAITMDDGVLLFLDTHSPAGEAGDYGPERLSWLKSALAEAADRPVYIFMHHPPVKTGFFIDHTMVQQAEEFQRVVAEAGNVRHMFFGHVHRASSGNWNGITWSTLHGLASQNDFELLPAKPNYRNGPAQIGILLIDGGSSVLHFQEVLDTFPIVAESGRSLRQPEIPEVSLSRTSASYSSPLTHGSSKD